MNTQKIKKAFSGKLWVVLVYEFKKMAFNKTFVILTILGPFLFAAISILPSFVAMKTMDRSKDALKVGVFLESEQVLPVAEKLLFPAFEERGWTLYLSDDKEELRSKVLDKSLEGFLIVPVGFPSEESLLSLGWYSKSTTDIGVFDLIEDALTSIVINQRILNSGLDEIYLRSLSVGVTLPVYKVSETIGEDGKSTNQGDFIAAMLTSVAFCMLIYMTVLLYGQQVGRSVVAEKSSKIVDVLLSSISSEKLLYGKLLGIGLAGIIQYAVWISFAVIIIHVVGPLVNFVLPIEISSDKYVLLLLFFVGGYLLYSSIYAACGAASEDDQHMAQLSMPILLFLIVPIILLQYFIQQPDSLLTICLSYFPFTSPMVMLMRTLVTEVSLWSVMLSLLILGVTIMLMTRLAGKIFRTGILMTGKNFTFKDIALWIKS